MPPSNGGSGAAQSFYGRWAALYDALARYTPGIGSLRERAAAALELDRGDTVVEMGCGTGANLPYLREQVGAEGTVVGIDFTRPVLDRARKSVAEYDNVHVVRGDATQPPIDAADSASDLQAADAADPSPNLQAIDGVLATFVVGMLDDPAAAVDDWCNLVGPGGNVVLVDAASSDHRSAPIVNAAFRALVVLSTPPTTRLRYDRDPQATLDQRVEAARDALRERSGATAHETHALGVVRLTGGRID
ncbi:Methyltransferase domain-containing protein [Natronoarchaeum philippinense]|uniref:Methyltransferase domain-containing protein n=1 Tax=Natronoarchaeum philippinense TaxID=558529 RepID=A0A285NW96_NATPI|nr:methyltransferase domain-containing protein [Natronoarchaeum philippinense]SNZ13498.1 Methyltransferase domain-containing protein [Natronoarchaeum philippinense]